MSLIKLSARKRFAARGKRINVASDPMSTRSMLVISGSASYEVLCVKKLVLK
jgi:hypothetical protein